MKQQVKHRLLAIFFLMVFSLNTLAGFACSVGMNMGYNATHHKHKTLHCQKYSHHNESNELLQSVKTSPDDDCCAHDVVRFTLLDKAEPDSALSLQLPVFLLAFTTTFFTTLSKGNEVVAKTQLQGNQRSWPPNHTNIRVAIQSFQI